MYAGLNLLLCGMGWSKQRDAEPLLSCVNLAISQGESRVQSQISRRNKHAESTLLMF